MNAQAADPRAGAVFKIKAAHVTCGTAKDVAGQWYILIATGESGRKVYDRKDRLWRCKVTREATGTDPGYYPYTDVRCTRGSAKVTFKLRS